MGLAMKQAIMACAWMVLIAIGDAGDASAAVWQWGCSGPLGDRQIIFSRSGLIVVPRKTSLGTLHDVIFRDDLTKGLDDYEGYNLDDDNAGFQPKMTYTSQDDAKRKLIMIEKSSQRISHRSHLVCGRDEITDIIRKVYRYKPDGARPQNVIMQCMEYQLTTTGGRPCTFN
jgi:hypothetical protein